MHEIGQTRRTGRRVALAVAFALAALAGGFGNAGPAAAHGDEGELTVITAEPAGHLQVRLLVGLLYENDAEPATDATVTVTGTGPEGSTLASTPLPRGEGAKYGATISGLANGGWTFTVASVNPTATASVAVEVLVSQSVSTTTPTATTTEAPPTTPAPGDPTTTEVPTAADPGDQSSDDDTSPAVLAAIAIAAIAAVAGIGLYLRSRHAKDEPG